MSDPSKSNTFEIVTMTDTDDEIYESTEFDGSVTVTIKDISNEPAPNYTIRTSSVKVNVISEDIPAISISAPTTAVSEGDQVAFTITATGQWETTFSVAVNADDGNANAFGTTEPANSIEFDPNTSANSVNKMYTINTVDDDVDETENRVTVTIVSSSGTYHYKIPDDGTETASTNLVDKGPTISLEFVNDYVTKSQPAQFKVTASSKVASNVTILVDVSGTNCISGNAPTQTMISEGESEGTLDVMTISDQSAPECMITAALNADARYKVHERKYSGTVRVGNDVVYTVSIARPNPINEGQDAVFTITTLPIPESAIEIDLNINQVGNYILWNVPRTIITNNTSPDTELTIKTKIDSMDESPGSITVEIMAGDGYRSGSPDSATINILDSDDSDNSSLSRVSVADSAVTAILNALPSLVGVKKIKQL